MDASVLDYNAIAFLQKLVSSYTKLITRFIGLTDLLDILFSLHPQPRYFKI